MYRTNEGLAQMLWWYRTVVVLLVLLIREPKGYIGIAGVKGEQMEEGNRIDVSRMKGV